MKSDALISVYANCFDRVPAQDDSIPAFLTSIKSGHWKDDVLTARSLEKEPYTQFKKTLPAVTISGTFNDGRKDSDLDRHSGFICFDFDHIDPIELKDKVSKDPYTYAAFTSLSGKGLAVLVRVSKGETHHAAYFELLREYYRTNFHIEVDPSCSNVSRLRIVSYDPDCYINHNAKIWSKSTGLAKVEKQKRIHEQSHVIATVSDFHRLIASIAERNIDITDGYNNWLTCAFALAHEFGNDGRGYFHAISSCNPAYESEATNKQYDHALRTPPGDPITINSFYYFAKIAGFEVSSQLTKEAVNIISVKRAGGESKGKAKKAIQHLGLPDDEAEYITEQVYSAPENRQFLESLTMAERVELFLLNNYDLRINEINDNLEVSGKPMTRRFISQAWIEVQKFVDEKASRQLVVAALESNKIETFNPIKDFFTSRIPTSTGNIDRLAACITSSTTILGMDPLEYRKRYIAKWMVGIPAAVFGGRPNPLALALCGKLMNTGKTEFFRRMVPDKLKRFFDESSLDHPNDRDNVIKLSSNIIIMDDEGGSKNYNDVQKFKSMTSRSGMKIRRLYSDAENVYQRIATFAITSNRLDVLKDATGNRRIIPIHVTEVMDFDLYNSINKEDLFLEAYQMYLDGFDLDFTPEEVRAFSFDLSEFMDVDMDETVISYYARPGDLIVPAAMLYRYIMMMSPAGRVSAKFFGQKCNDAGLDRVKKKIKGASVWCYLVDEKTAKLIDEEGYKSYNEILPF